MSEPIPSPASRGVFDPAETSPVVAEGADSAESLRATQRDETEVPENIRKAWGDDAVLCTHENHDSPAWHHRNYHEPPGPHSLRVRFFLIRKSLGRELRYLMRGR